VQKRWARSGLPDPGAKTKGKKELKKREGGDSEKGKFGQHTKDRRIPLKQLGGREREEKPTNYFNSSGGNSQKIGGTGDAAQPQKRWSRKKGRDYLQLLTASLKG